MIFDLFKETIWSLTGNKVRSALTMLGIIIGIASVIAMVAIGQGAQNSIAQNIQSLGSNLIIVMPGSQQGGGISQGRGSAQTLTREDATALGTLPDVQAVAPEISRRYQVTAGGNNTNTQVDGSLPSYMQVRNVQIDLGSFFTDQQVQSGAKVAVLGPTARDDLFGADANPVGASVHINNVAFTVIGVTVSKGGSGFNNPDDYIYVPITADQYYLAGANANYVSDISVAATSSDTIATAQQEVTDLLLQRHKITDPTAADFSILNQSDIISAASSVTGTFTTLLASIAGISLLVGGIGIMNMMLTTVTERTREIGLRKAVGIRKIYINLQFLAEAVVLTFLGGAIGILLGWITSIVASRLLNMTTVVSPSAVFLAFGVSAAIGIIFGFYPARRAAALSPIEALRYE
ncbi:MAG: ABC transporter permease [Candidatus Pacebacteria bacterium]|nr:ABC transporter permease [Candidatus Paceibacterota bacterium]